LSWTSWLRRLPRVDARLNQAHQGFGVPELVKFLALLVTEPAFPKLRQQLSCPLLEWF
jgi:hypothetical protein